MKIHKKIALELSRKSKDELKKYKFIGAEIKSSRLKMSKTLDAIDNVNKSISYISKIETNKIVPNEKCLRELCDELLIPREDLESMSRFDDCILDAIKAIYMLDYEKIKSLFDIYSSFKNIRTNLMKGLYYYLFDMKKEIKDVIEDLSKIEGSLSIEDYLVYVLLCVKDLILDKKNIQAYNVVKVVLESQTAKEDILCIFRMLKYEIKTSFKFNLFESDYYEVINMHVAKSNINRIKECINNHNRTKLELLAQSIDDNKIESLIESDHKFYAYCLKNNIEEASKLFNDELSNSDKLFYYYITKDLDMIMKMILGTMGEEDMIVANSYKLELEGNYEAYRNYLMNICIPYYIKIAKFTCLYHYYDILVDLNTKVSKYKDSGILGKEIAVLFKQICMLTT